MKHNPLTHISIKDPTLHMLEIEGPTLSKQTLKALCPCGTHTDLPQNHTHVIVQDVAQWPHIESVLTRAAAAHTERQRGHSTVVMSYSAALLCNASKIPHT